MMFSDFDEEEVFKYFQEKINPIFTELTIALVKSKPENILSFITKWFIQLNKK